MKEIAQSSAKELTISEPWREVLRLCIASCHDDDVDSALLAILEPMKGEISETTARPRAVLAALCLADEPNVKENVAKKVLREFVRQIGPNDGKNYGTSVDNAVLELAASQWRDILQKFLEEERNAREGRHDASQWNAASLGLSIKNAVIQLVSNQTTAQEPALNQTTSEYYSKSIFLSYARHDWAKYARPLKSYLSRKGFTVWVDQKLIEGGQNWLDEINQALRKCESMVLCVTPKALESKWVKMEYRYFFCEEKPIIPVICLEAELPAELISIQYLSYSQRGLLAARLQRICS